MPRRAYVTKAIVDADWWREVFLLGVGKIRQGGLGNAAHVVNVLVPEAAGEVEDPRINASGSLSSPARRSWSYASAKKPRAKSITRPS